LAEFGVKCILKRVWARRRLRWALILALPAMIVFSVVSVELTSTSTFCNSCHIMNTFYDSWKVSSHKDVECIQCHIPPGLTNLVSAKLNGLGQAVDDILERTGTQPSANVADGSCTRGGCHELEKVRAVPKIEKRYFFAHAKHLDLEYQGIKIHCNTCHSHIKGGKHFEVNAGVCVTCHLLKTAPGSAPTQLAEGTVSAPLVRTADLKTIALVPAVAMAPPTAAETAAGAPKTPTRQCRDCHQPPAQPIQYHGLKVVHAEYLAYGAACESCHRGVTAAPEPITDDRCLGCHDFGRERTASVSQLHEQHSSGRHKVECFSCHGLIRHGPSAQTMRLDQFDCRACHQGQHQIQQETYRFAGQGADAHQPPDAQAVTPMFMAHVDCTGCHTQVRSVTDKRAAGATVAAATAKACDSCHKPGLGDQMIPLWQKNTRTLYENVERMLSDAAKPPASPRAQQLIAEARQLLTLVRLDGSWGVHNPPYTQKLIEQARDKILEATGPVAGSSAPPASASATPVR
jgi:nitrate/TMAO reductase-like tetraheme cytochrome c subunit